MAQRGDAGGCIPANQCITDDATPTITASGVSEAHQNAIFATSYRVITVNVRKDYRTRLRRFVNFIFTDYPEIFEDATVIIIQEQMAHVA